MNGSNKFHAEKMDCEKKKKAGEITKWPG